MRSFKRRKNSKMRSGILSNTSCILSLILVLGLGLRLYSINYGLPYVVGPDEVRQILDALSMGARKSLVPLDYTYPALHKYCLLFFFAIYYMLGFMLKMFSGVDDFVFKFLVDPGGIFLAGRLLSAFFGIAIMLPVYWIAKSLYSKRAGIQACLFSVFMFSLNIHSQWAISDIMLTFLSTCAFYYVLRCASGCAAKDYILAGVFIGAASATKYQGLYLLVPFLAAITISVRKIVLAKRIFLSVFLSFSIIIFLTLLGNLAFVFNFKESLRRLLELKDETMGISSLDPFNHNYFSVIGWFIKEIILQEKLLGLTLAGGLLYSVYKHSKEDLIFLIFISFCLFSLTGFGFRSLHLLVYSFAVLCVFGARFLDGLIYFILKERYKVSHALISATLITTPLFYSTVISDAKRSNPDTRILAKGWIEGNIPYGSKIAEDWYDFSVPLQSELPMLFREEKLVDYYVRYFSEDIRQRYKDYAHAKGVYNLMQIKHETTSPLWPEDMPAEAIMRAEKIPLLKRLYCWFNFRGLGELKEDKVSYIIISNYAYNHFLFDDDIRKKTGLYNPFMLEDTLGSNRQARSYVKGSKYGLLFHLAERARDFYLPLLNQEDPGAELIKEIRPDKYSLGPIIKIYRFK